MVRRKQVKNLAVGTEAEVAAVEATEEGSDFFIVLEDGAVYRRTTMGSYRTTGKFIREIISFLDFTVDEPSDPELGDRYIAQFTGTSNQTATGVTENYMYTYVDSVWEEMAPQGNTTLINDEDGKIYVYHNDQWVSNLTEANNATAEDIALNTTKKYVDVPLLNDLLAQAVAFGRFVGSTITYLAFPLTRPDLSALQENDWGTLTTTDGVNPAGIYVWNGSAWALAFPSSAINLITLEN